MSELHPLPTLDELAMDPAKAEALSGNVVKHLLVKHAKVGEVLLTRLIAEPSAQSQTNGLDRFLDAREVGEVIGKSRSWVEKNTKSLPKRRKVGAAGMWSEREIQTWIKHREPWD